jgi:cytochrome oxidase Cu insertion factor (SCO1/SenC/PrrC family)
VKVRALLLAAAVMPVCAFAHEGVHTRVPDAQTSRNAEPAHTTLATPDSSIGAPTDARDRAARMFFSDRRLLTQRGEDVRFYSDVLKDRVVLINFVFTQCADTCPMQTAKVAAIQALLGNTADVRLVSISVDPRHDTPAALARYATTFGAGTQWTFLTGRSDDVDDVLRRLGQWTENPRSHTALFIAGNASTGHWMKLHPDLTPALIAAELRALVAETPRTGVSAAPPLSSAEARSTDIVNH